MKQLLPGVTRALQQVGRAFRTARIRRRLSQQDLAHMMGTSIGTVQRIERGDPGVAIGNIALGCLCLNCLDDFAKLLDPSLDELGTAADTLRLPKRVRSNSRIHKNDNKDDSNPKPMAF